MAPTAARRALGRSRVVQRANIAFATTFPAPWRPPLRCRTPSGRSPCPSARSSRRSPYTLVPLVFQEGCGAASQGPTGHRVWVDYSLVHCKVPHPAPRLEQYVRWAASFCDDVHLAVMRNWGLGKDPAEKGLCDKVPGPVPLILTRHGVVAEDVHRPSA